MLYQLSYRIRCFGRWRMLPKSECKNRDSACFLQPLLRKKTGLWLLMLLFCGQRLVAQAPDARLLARADSAFAARQYGLSRLLYEDAARWPARVHPAVYLKLAYLFEQARQPVSSQYYLNRYYEKVPDGAVLTRLTEQARQHRWPGYGIDGVNLLLLLYRQYGVYLILAGLLAAAYVFAVLLGRRLRRQYIPFRYKLYFVLFLLALTAAVNLTGTYGLALVHRSGTVLRTAPSAGAPVLATLTAGHRLIVLGSPDVYLRVLDEHRRLAYLRQADAWPIR